MFKGGHFMRDFSFEINDAIRNGKWLNVQYNNGNEITKFYAAIIDFDVENELLYVKMFNLSKDENILYGNNGVSYKGVKIYYKKIVSCSVLHHFTHKQSSNLIDKLESYKFHPAWINNAFGEKRIFNYYIHALRYDVSPFIEKEFHLKSIDSDIFTKSSVFKPESSSFYEFLAIITNFDKKLDPRKEKNLSYAFNLVNIRTPKGVFPILYKDFLINLDEQTLELGTEVKVHRSIQLGEKKIHISRYLEIEEKDLAQMYLKKPKRLKKLLVDKLRSAKELIDTTPILFTLKRQQVMNIDDEIRAIRDMDNKHHPLNAFLGNLTNRNKGRKDYPIFLLDSNVNIDQLRVINSSLKMPVTYVQGPPGTGKTTTILNVILSYFANERTVLLSSYNNKPVDDVYLKLKSIAYKNKLVPFPVLRLGNMESVTESLKGLVETYKKTKNITVYDSTLDKLKSSQIDESMTFYDFLKTYEDYIEYRDKKENLELILEQVSKVDSQQFNLNIDINADLSEIQKKIDEIGPLSDDYALKLLNQDFDEFNKWLYYKSCSYYQKLDQQEFQELKDLLLFDYKDEKDLTRDFNKYISDETNLRKLMKIFPIIITTNLSSNRLATPKPYFDLTVIDEAGQCNVPSSLLPIARGEKLLLVGDVQQLKPVISLEDSINKKLMELYKIREEYNYVTNSILSTMREMDAVSLKVLLRFHYRCCEKIIRYSNRTYYSDKLKVKTISDHEGRLILEDIKSSKWQSEKNTAKEEVNRIRQIIKENPTKEYGIITPFRSQSELIKKEIEQDFPDVEVGTIHKFQGGEKDGIIISCGLTQNSHQKTYDWLKGNHPLINVAVTRAKSELRILADKRVVNKLSNSDDNFYELIKYVESNGDVRCISSTADDSNIKHLDSYFEKLFKETLSIVTEHFANLKFDKKVKVSSVLSSAKNSDFDYFTRAEFDFVIFDGEKAIAVYEVDGNEHENQQETIERDRKKQEICDQDGIKLFRIKNKDVKNYELIKSKLYKLY